MRPRYSARLPIDHPGKTGRFGDPEVDRSYFNVYMGKVLPEAENLTRAVNYKKNIERISKEDNPLMYGWKPADHVEILKRPLTYFGSYALKETVYIETIERLTANETQPDLRS